MQDDAQVDMHVAAMQAMLWMCPTAFRRSWEGKSPVESNSLTARAAAEPEGASEERTGKVDKGSNWEDAGAAT